MQARQGTTTATRTPKSPRPMTRTQRKTLATKEIMKAVGATAPTDKESAIVAALESVSERLRLEPGFEVTFRQKYEEFQTLGTGGEKVDQRPMPQPKPSFHLATHNPLANLSPYEIADAWEHRDFRTVLEHAGRDLLREMVGVVLARNAGTKPPNRNKPDAMIDFIVMHVLGTGY